MNDVCKKIQKILLKNPSMIEDFQKHREKCPDCDKFMTQLEYKQRELKDNHIENSDNIITKAFNTLQFLNPRIVYQKLKISRKPLTILITLCVSLTIIIGLYSLIKPAQRLKDGVSPQNSDELMNDAYQRQFNQKYPKEKQKPEPPHSPKRRTLQENIDLESTEETKPPLLSDLMSDGVEGGLDSSDLANYDIQSESETSTKSKSSRWSSFGYTGKSNRSLDKNGKINETGQNIGVNVQREFTERLPDRDSFQDVFALSTETDLIEYKEKDEVLKKSEIKTINSLAYNSEIAGEPSEQSNKIITRKPENIKRKEESRSEENLFQDIQIDAKQNVADEIDRRHIFDYSEYKKSNRELYPPHYWSFLPKFGYGILDYQPDVWKGVTLDHPVYFNNTYVGGNALIKYYSCILTQNNSFFDNLSELSKLTMLHTQPYDPPEKGALALYAHLDQTTITKRSRIFLQIGIRGTEQFTWRRPPVTIVVLNLLEEAKKNEADLFVETLLSRLDTYDEIGLISQEHMIYPTSADNFRNKLKDPAKNITLSNFDTLSRWYRIEQCFQRQPERNLNQNKRLIILTKDNIDDFDLVKIHELVLRDINTSLISWDVHSLFNHASAAQCGGGNLYFISNQDDITKTAQEELLSLEKVVARALRLSIQLAPEVNLIQVIGSHPLSSLEKKNVKETERAVDLKLSQTSGIESNRGKDDPGLQTIIPYFYGGDEHIIVLELEVIEPGSIADVSLKYKDMVDMRNATLNTAVALSKRPSPATPRQEVIVKNILSISTVMLLHNLQMDTASRQQQVALLTNFLQDFQSLPEQILNDPSITRDRALLEYVRNLLHNVPENQLTYLNHLLKYTEIKKNISPNRM